MQRHRDTNQPTLWDRVEFPSTRSTSRAARREIRPRANTIRIRILHAIAQAGAVGLSDDEGETLLGVRPPSYTPRRLELRQDGFIIDSGQRRATGSGLPAVVWCVTDAGRALLREVFSS